MGDRQRKAEHQIGVPYSIDSLGGYGYLLLAVRKDTAEALAEDGEYIPVSVDDAGRLHIAGEVTASALPSGAATAANQALGLTELRSMNLLSSIVYDEILVTYTDSGKGTISKVEWKLSSAVVKTLTPTFGSTTDAWVKT